MSRNLTNVATTDLQVELRKRARRLQTLRRRRERLANQLAELDAEIQAIGGTVESGNGRAAPRKRPRNDMSLEEALAKLLKNKTMGVSEIADAVQRAGYRTSSPNFRTIVNQTLINSPAFKRVSRGQYTAKG